MDRYGSLETGRGVSLYQEEGSECAAFAMDAVYAWDQQDIDIYVFVRVDRPDHPADIFQTTLVGAEAGVALRRKWTMLRAALAEA